VNSAHVFSPEEIEQETELLGRAAHRLGYVHGKLEIEGMPLPFTLQPIVDLGYSSPVLIAWLAKQFWAGLNLAR
jgi:hypothetical protein